jgi:vacuolar-type H+-ATPase subunit E/Vma4
VSTILGDLSKLLSAVKRGVEVKAQTRLDEAVKAAEEILKRSYEDALSSSTKRIEEEARRLSERLAALEAAKTVELRKKLTALKAKVADEVVREAFNRFRELLGEDRYSEVILRLAREAIRSLRERGATRYVLVPVERDRRVVAEIAEKLRNEGVSVEVGDESVEGLGGFIATSPETGIRLDYRFETVFSQAIEEARAAALKALFG